MQIFLRTLRLSSRFILPRSGWAARLGKAAGLLAHKLTHIPSVKPARSWPARWRTALSAPPLPAHSDSSVAVTALWQRMRVWQHPDGKHEPESLSDSFRSCRNWQENRACWIGDCGADQASIVPWPRCLARAKYGRAGPLVGSSAHKSDKTCGMCAGVVKRRVRPERGYWFRNVYSLPNRQRYENSERNKCWKRRVQK